MAAPVRVVVADDNRVVRFGLRTLLEREPDLRVVAECGDGREVAALTRHWRPEVVLLDVELPGIDGPGTMLDITRQAHVAVLTRVDDALVVTRSVIAGVLGYLVHGQFDPAGLADVVRHVAAGQAYLTETAATAIIDRLRQDLAWPPDTAVDALTAREREVLDLVARGLSNRSIADGLGLSIKTVKNHLHHIFERLGVTDRQAAATLWLSRRPGTRET